MEEEGREEGWDDRGCLNALSHTEGQYCNVKPLLCISTSMSQLTSENVCVCNNNLVCVCVCRPLQEAAWWMCAVCRGCQ